MYVQQDSRGPRTAVPPPRGTHGARDKGLGQQAGTVLGVLVNEEAKQVVVSRGRREESETRLGSFWDSPDMSHCFEREYVSGVDRQDRGCDVCGWLWTIRDGLVPSGGSEGLVGLCF